MKKILITGATDGLGLETAKMFAKGDFHLLLHGRNQDKLLNIKQSLETANNKIDIYTADFSNLAEVKKMAKNIIANQNSIDAIINNAGVFVVNKANAQTVDDIDIRFSVNTIAPYLLTKTLIPILSKESRVVNVTSAAQTPIDFNNFKRYQFISDSDAYAQSKLALIMWTMSMAETYINGPNFIAVNPKSFLGSKMVKEAYGRTGYDLKIGAEILYKSAISDEFNNVTGEYFDNDYGIFSQPHPFALNSSHRLKLMSILDLYYAKY